MTEKTSTTKSSKKGKANGSRSSRAAKRKEVAPSHVPERMLVKDSYKPTEFTQG